MTEEEIPQTLPMDVDTYAETPDPVHAEGERPMLKKPSKILVKQMVILNLLAKMDKVVKVRLKVKERAIS